MAAIDDYLTCAVCLEWFKFPRRLPCFHVYCLECIRGLVKPGKNYIKCPECRCLHVLPNEKVEDFLEDGRLVQFLDEQKKHEPQLCNDCKQFSVLSDCDHCHLSICRDCQIKHRAQLLESLLHESLLFYTDHLTGKQMEANQKLKSELLRQKENLGVLKMIVDQEMSEIMKELRNRQLALMSRIEDEENSILEKLSKLDNADSMASLHPRFISDLVGKISLPKSLDSMKEQLAEQKQLIDLLHGANRKKGKLRIKFNEKQSLRELIASYGVFFTHVDYEREFTLLTTLDGSDSGGEFDEPWGLTVCPFTDNVYVTDSSSIRVYTNEGKYIHHMITNDIPCGLAIDNDQRIIVTSFQDNNVKIYNRQLELMKSFGSEGYKNGQFSAPLGVACDVDNNIYVVDRDNKRIQVFTSDGTFKSEIGRRVLKGPRCIQINEKHEILVTDRDLGRVVIFSRDGTQLRSIIGDGEKKLKGLMGICVDKKGHVLLADLSNKRIQVYKDHGEHYCTMIEPAAVMKAMCGLAVTASGVIFITDLNGSKIHLIVCR